MYGHAFGGPLTVLFAVFSVLGTIVAALVAIGLVVVLVRFLLVATKAAQIYVDEHGKKAVAPAVQPTPLVTHPTPDPAPDEPLTPAPTDLDEETVIAPKRKRTPPTAP